MLVALYTFYHSDMFIPFSHHQTLLYLLCVYSDMANVCKEILNLYM
jgi:hypothetical protein